MGTKISSNSYEDRIRIFLSEKRLHDYTLTRRMHEHLAVAFVYNESNPLFIDEYECLNDFLKELRLEYKSLKLIKELE